MDAYTQRLLERTRERSERLAKKMAETETSPKRKRETPLAESTEINIKTKGVNDGSPNKRPCLRESESTIKPDTPAIASIRSRRNQINSYDENTYSDTPAKTVVSSLTVTDLAPSSPIARKSRLAALASNIQNWEDDLGHPTMKKEEKSAKSWQPPQVDDTISSGPPKPARTFQHSVENSSPRKYTADVGNAHQYISPKKDSSPIKTKSPVNKSPTPYRKQPSPAKYSPVKSPASSNKRITNLRQKSSNDLNQSINEPTKTPVRARLAGWQQKVDDTSKPQQPVFKTPGKLPLGKPKSAIQRVAATVSEDDPLNMSIHSRMNAWETKVQEVEKEKKSVSTPSKSLKPPSPIKARAPPAVNANKITSPVKPASTVTRKSPGKVVSPSKLGSATKSIHEKLQQIQQENWKKNEISEKIQTQKQKELEGLQNRWKNGMLNEEGAEPAPSVSAPPAPPPPPPPMGYKAKQNDADKAPAPSNVTQNKSPIKSAQNQKKNISASREQAREHMRNVTDITQSKVVTTNFNNKETVTVKKQTVPSSQLQQQTSTRVVSSITHTPVSQRRPQPVCTPGGTSLYGLIKKQEMTPVTHRPVNQYQTPDMNRRPQPTPSTGSQHDSFEDSFDSQTDVDKYESQSSLTSETQSETNTEDYTEGYTETEDDRTQDEEFTEEYSDEYSDESEVSELDDNEVNDLLDEALSETESEVSLAQPAPRRQNTSPTRKPRVNISMMTHIQPLSTPTGSSSSYDYQQRNNRSSMPSDDTRKVKFDVPSSNYTATSSSASDSENDKAMVYSLEMYRTTSKMMKNNTPAPKVTVVRHSQHRPEEHYRQQEEALPYIPEKPDKDRLRELQDLITQEQNVIMQTSNALNQCCGSHSAFAGTLEDVECHRLLLTACKRREAYMSEMNEIRAGRGKHKGPKGSLTISDMRIPLKKDFMHRVGGPNDSISHFFILLIRHGTHVVFTQMVGTHKMKDTEIQIKGSLDFPNLIKINDIQQNFKIVIEIYGMTVTREMGAVTPKKKKGMTPKKLLKAKTMQSPGGPSAVRSTNFVEVASITITANILNKTHFNLERVSYSSPLQGTIYMRLNCLMESKVEMAGFLTMFEDVSGFGAWHRRWCALKNNYLCFWKYPDDEFTKEPIGRIDLKQCITDVVGLIPRDVCARPQTFELLTVRRQTKEDSETLVTRCYNTMATTKHWVSADQKDDRTLWCDKLNEALRNIRTWHSDALRPIRKADMVKQYNPYGQAV